MMRETELIGVMQSGIEIEREEHALQTVTCGGLQAILGPAAGAPKRQPQRHVARQLLTRQRILEALDNQGDVLPARPFTTLAPAEAERFLRLNSGGLSAALAENRGRVQHQIRITWDPAGALMRFRDAAEFSDLGERPSAAALTASAEAFRQRMATECIDRLRSACSDLIRLPSEGVEMLVNLVVLGSRSTERLEQRLEETDAIWPEGLRIAMIGPLPPVSFAAIAVARIPPSEIEAAKTCLGLASDEEPDKEAVRVAYRRRIRDCHPDQSSDSACSIDEIGRAGKLLGALVEGQHPLQTTALLASILREDELAPRSEEALREAS